MQISHELKIWAFIILHAITVEGKCPGGQECMIIQPKPTQIGMSQVTRFLQCSKPDCQSAIFVSSPNMICLIRRPNLDPYVDLLAPSNVSIFLGNCPEFFKNPGYFISNTGNVVNSTKGMTPSNTFFTDEGCGTMSETSELVKFIGISNNRMLIADNTTADNTIADITGLNTSSMSNCDLGLYVYPDIFTNSESSGRRGTYTPPKRQCPSRTRQRALLTTTDGVSEFAVGAPEQLSDVPHRLPIVQKLKGEVFFIQNYTTRAIGAKGTIELVTAYTLQLARSKKYLVADVLEDTTLNYTGPNSTGLILKDASEFPGGYALEPDYRFFVQYNVTTTCRRTASVFCPLFHRNHCLYPGVSGYLRLTPLSSTDSSLEPTFENPTEDVLRRFVQSSKFYTTQTGAARSWYVRLSVL